MNFKSPYFEEPETPINSAVLKISNNLLFLISIIFETANVAITMIGFQSLEWYYKVIIILSISCLILFIDLIVLYLKEREHYFKEVYANNIYRLLSNQTADLYERVNKIECENSKK